jgi:hypothetical protein
MRNGICAYDEKYGLYVKTSCHGKQTITQPRTVC